MTTQRLYLARIATGLFSLACLFATISPPVARAQAEYSLDGSDPQPQDYPPPGRASRPTGKFNRFEPKFEFSLFLGSRFGGNVVLNTPNVDYLKIDPSFNWGFNAGTRIAPHLFGEFMWNRQTTTLRAHDTPTNELVPLTNHAHLDLYQASLAYEVWASSRIRPFVVGGIGFTHFDSNRILSFSNRFSYNLGGGVKYLFAPPLALRAELRWSPSRTTSSSTVFCDPFLGCFTTSVSSHAQQWQANIGIEFRF